MVQRVAVVLLGLIFALSLTGMALAQEKAKPEKPAAPAAPPAAKPAEVKPEAAPPAAKGEAKPEAKKEVKKAAPAKYRMGGIVTAVDPASRKITIKQDRVKKGRTVNLTVTKKAAQELSGINKGDAVNAWVSGSTVTTLTKIY